VNTLVKSTTEAIKEMILLLKENKTPTSMQQMRRKKETIKMEKI
jgi:hypothetical protein